MMRTNQVEGRAPDPVTAAHDARGTLAEREKSIVVTGFMGTGKTSVGRLIAEKMGRAFEDMDSRIVRREGKAIPKIFETRGEAYFRECEKQTCKELAVPGNLVIATGGGTLIDPENRACFRDAFVVCLDATIDALLARLKNATDRPLLQGEELRRQVTNLLSSRSAAYEAIGTHVDTTGKTVDQVAAEIIALFRSAEIGVGRGAD